MQIAICTPLRIIEKLRFKLNFHYQWPANPHDDSSKTGLVNIFNCGNIESSRLILEVFQCQNNAPRN